MQYIYMPQVEQFFCYNTEIIPWTMTPNLMCLLSLLNVISKLLCGFTANDTGEFVNTFLPLVCTLYGHVDGGLTVQLTSGKQTSISSLMFCITCLETYKNLSFHS